MAVDYTRCILRQYPSITEGDFEIAQDGEFVRITQWNEAGFGVKPDLGTLEVNNWLAICKEDKHLQIKDELQEELTEGDSGYMLVGLANNFRIDSSRGDLSNMQNLRDFISKKVTIECNLQGITDQDVIDSVLHSQSIPIKDYHNEMRMVTVRELDTVIFELQSYGLWLYQHKWEKDQQIEAMGTIAEVEAIKFMDME